MYYSQLDLHLLLEKCFVELVLCLYHTIASLTEAPSTSLYNLVAASRSGTAMATWLSRPNDQGLGGCESPPVWRGLPTVRQRVDYESEGVVVWVKKIYNVSHLLWLPSNQKCCRAS